MGRTKTIALVAHDNRKKALMEWVSYNYSILKDHQLVCTGTTGKLVEASISKLLKDHEEIKYPIIKLKSGPLGGDQQLGAMISEGKIDYLVFLWDPMQPQPHDVDVKALNRIAVLYNIPVANNRATADFIITSKLFSSNYQPILTDYSGYIGRDPY
jgi:methylglyoxal synthase